MHIGLGADGYIPAFMDMTSGKVHEINWAKTLKLPQGSFVCFDCGFIDYAWYSDLTINSIFFVTRLKSKADVEYLLKRAGRKSPGITSNQAILSKASRSQFAWSHTPMRKPVSNIALSPMHTT